jgi:hypothetical protein
MTEIRQRSVSRAPRNQNRDHAPAPEQFPRHPNVEIQLISTFFKGFQSISNQKITSELADNRSSVHLTVSPTSKLEPARISD